MTNYVYGWLNQNEQRFLLVTAANKLVFVGGPEDGLEVACRLLRVTKADKMVAGAVEHAIAAGVAALLDGTQRQLAPAYYQVTGTVFEQRVYAALRAIPFGQTVTYSDLAVRVGQPSAVRAVAHAVACNPLLVVQPCHRVVPKNGGVGQYRGGVKMKKSLIGLESRLGQVNVYN